MSSSWTTVPVLQWGRGIGAEVSRGIRSLQVALLSVALMAAGCAIPRWPVDAPITSPYGIRFRGILPSVHRGVDLGVPVGTEARVMSAGRVRFVGTMEGFGQVVWVDHGGSVMTVYAHLSRILVEEGQLVRGRQVIALSGASGDVTAPHLHFELWRWGRQQDPVTLLGGFPGN